jgi:hypothetical protein
MNHLKRIAEKQKSNICFHNSFYYSLDPEKDSGRFRKIQEDSRRFKKIQEDSRRFWEIQEDSGRFKKIQERFKKDSGFFLFSKKGLSFSLIIFFTAYKRHFPAFGLLFRRIR